MFILGINLNSHDSGAALIKDGCIVAVVNEERFSRIKMDGVPPHQSIAYVLSEAGINEKYIEIYENKK